MPAPVIVIGLEISGILCSTISEKVIAVLELFTITPTSLGNPV